MRIDASPKAAEVWMALADDSATSQVMAGENKGRSLHHVAIVRSLRKIGVLKRGVGFDQAVAVPVGAARVVVFVQDGGLGKVYGVGAL